MFIVVRYGENEQSLFNLNCRTRVLYENIKERCDCDSEDCIDLADENGVLKGFPDRLTENEYGCEFLTSRASYILLQIHFTTTKNGVTKSYTPMLNGVSESIPDFMSKLYNKKVNPDIVTSGRPSAQRNVVSPRISGISRAKISLSKPLSRGTQGRKSKS
ncbi:uncharacterized protein CXorf65 homolog isoform X1 [Exaiptasia diaphana]|uniref:Uncharacterized protein n=1 Tax=Exaiptasia diaphana TaxID=2652724 RepID=A0A913X0H6_EXADI|nr:uncharacterized protein CXorf65 homolog isoform X1 [Exaiptasia diaphana]